MGAIEDLMAGEIARAENFVDFPDAAEAFAAGGDGEDIVALAGFEEDGAGRDQSGDIVHLCPVEQARDVVVDAMADAHDALSENVEVTRNERGFDARIERGGEERRHTAAGDSHASDAFRVEPGN